MAKKHGTCERVNEIASLTLNSGRIWSFAKVAWSEECRPRDTYDM